MAASKETQRDASTQRIYEAALKEFVQRGLYGAAAASIAEAAGVSKGLITQRFGSKEKLIFDTFIRTQSETGFENKSDLVSLLKQQIEVAEKVYFENKNKFLFLHMLLNMTFLPDAITDYIKDRFNQAGIDRLFEKQDNAFKAFVTYTRLIVNAIYAAGEMEAELPKPEELLQIIKIRKETTQIKDKTSDSITARLAGDYETVMSVTILENRLDDYCISCRDDTPFLKLIPDWNSETNFHNRLKLLCQNVVHPEDRTRFYEETRRQAILGNLDGNNAYYVEFRTLVNGTVGYYQMKFITEKDNKTKSFVAGIHDISKEKNRTRAERKTADIINVLSHEYTAVYYVDLISGTYDIIYQLGHVKRSVNNMLKNNITFKDAFVNYVEMLVHPDYKNMMRREVELITEHLKHQKQFKVEFLRNYSGEYRYTEMKCVKVGEAEDELTAFVVGFAENDSEYRNVVEQQKQLEQAVTERSAELQEKNRTLNRINEEVIELLCNITEARDVDSGEHVKRVKGITRIIATRIKNDWPEYGLTDELIELISSASVLHDIGKIMIPDAILLKPGKLTKEEFAVMKTHCENGCEMLKRSPKDWSAAYKQIGCDICRYHHEKYDGKGYPTGLKGDEIPIAAQIVSVADCFDALITKRVYKEAYSPETAFDMIINGECGAFSDKILSSLNACREELLKHVKDGDIVNINDIPVAISSQSLSWTKLLLVDDDDMSRQLCSDILKSEGADVVCASSGKEAVDIFQKSMPGTFDAILMDVIMPEINGLAATAIIRESGRTDAKKIPIIALITSESEQEESNCLAYGMDSFVTKPISISTINKVLQECISKHTAVLDNAVRKANENAQQRLNETLSDISLSGFEAEYEFVCYVNGNINDISCYRASQTFDMLITATSSRLPFNRRFDMLFKRIVPANDFKDFILSVNRTNVISFLETHESFYTYVPTLINGIQAPYKLIIIPDKKYPGCYIIGLQSVDAEEKEDMRARELIRKLTESYIAVDYLDLNGDTYKRFKKPGSIGESLSGCYSELVNKYVSESVYEEDKEMLRASISRQNLTDQLKIHNIFT